MRLTKSFWLYTGITLFVLFLLTTLGVTSGVFSNIDKITLERVSYYHTNALTQLFIIYHYAFETTTLIIITFLMSITFYFLKKKKEAIIFAGIMALDGVLIYLTKTLMNVSGPVGRIIYESSSSFPSGHTTSAIVFIGLSTYMSIKYLKGEWSKAKWPLILEMIALSIFVAYSRIYLGVHWLSDIIGGALLGLSLLAIGIWVLEEESLRRDKHNK